MFNWGCYVMRRKRRRGKIATGAVI